jgi:hypothetical protein
MLAHVQSSAVLGIDAYQVHVEVDVSNGLPSMSIVGLSDAAVNESKERVRAAIKNSGTAYRGETDPRPVHSSPQCEAYVADDGTSDRRRQIVSGRTCFCYT